MKLSIFAVSTLVLSTSFATVGWADGHDQGVVDNPGAGGNAISRVAQASSVKELAGLGSGSVVDLTKRDNTKGTPAGADGGTTNGDAGNAP
jgi:hypothetical protein